MYRFPDLEQDAIQAARITIDDAIRKSRSMRIAARFNPKLEIGDIATLSFTQVATGDSISKKVIIESMRFICSITVRLSLPVDLAQVTRHMAS